MRVAFLVLILLASVVALNATTALTLCSTGGTPSGCAGTFSYSYMSELDGLKTGTPVILSPQNRFSGWAAATLGSWVSIQDAKALTPAGMELFGPDHPDGAITSDPLDSGSSHTWTHTYYVDYTLTFYVPAYLPGARIAGMWAADDGGLGTTGIYLNGVYQTQIPVWGTGSYADPMNPFDFVASNLQTGTNTLSFRVQHADSWYDGVLVDSVSLTGTPTPEPASLLLIGAGAALLFFRRRS